MARGENQKLKLLYLKQFFEEKTDEDHPANAITSIWRMNYDTRVGRDLR